MSYVNFSDRHLVIENIIFFYQTIGTADENVSAAFVEKKSSQTLKKEGRK